MKLFSVAITAEDREVHGWMRLLNEALHAIHDAYVNACASRNRVTIRITVTAEEPEERA